MNFSTCLAQNLGSKSIGLLNVCRYGKTVAPGALVNTNISIRPEDIYLRKLNTSDDSTILPPLKEINTLSTSIPIWLPEYTNNVIYENPLQNNKIIKPFGIGEESYVEKSEIESYQFNKLRNDTKNRKRAFVKRGYFRRTRALTRRTNRLSYAYALQGIDYEMLENLEMGEIPDLKQYFK